EKNLKIAAARAASMRDSRSGLPISRVMSCAISSTRPSIASAAPARNAPRLAAGSFAQPRRASSAALTAAATSSASELGNSPTGSSGRHGLLRSYVRPLRLGVHSPAMKLAAPVVAIVSDMGGFLLSLFGPGGGGDRVAQRPDPGDPDLHRLPRDQRNVVRRHHHRAGQQHRPRG